MITLEKRQEAVPEAFLKTLKRHRMLQKGERILVAVSGGPDSITLFDLLYQIRADWRLELHILHLNHSLRGDESEQDQHFTERFARDLKFPITVRKIDVADFAREKHLSLEEAARECRYAFFKEEAERLGIKKVALGHHKDDQAETVLFRIIRGTGLKGLGAMKPVSDWKGLSIIRPLIELEKKDIENYLKERKLSFCLDRSNEETRFARNKIRHRLLPDLETYYNPRIKNALAALAQTAALDLSFIEEKVDKRYPKILKKRRDSFLVLKRKDFLKEPEALRFRILQKAVHELHKDSELDFAHWDDFRKRLEEDARAYELYLGGDLSIALERKEIILRMNAGQKFPDYEYKVRPGGKVYLKEVGMEFLVEAFDQRIYKVDRKDRSCGIFDAEKMRFPLVIRNRREGDTFQPLGLPEEKKLKDFLIGRKIQSYDKDRIPLFVSNGEVFWVYGVEISERFKVAQETRRFLRISCVSGLQ